MEEVLSNLESWLVSHAPKTHAMLNPPATPDQIGALEADLGFPLLPEVAAVLRWHNGTSEDSGGLELAPTYWMVHAGSIAGDARMLNKGAKRYENDQWSERWVPLGADRCGAYLMVDHGEGHDHGRVFIWEPENGEGYSWPSLADLCAELSTALVQHTPWLNCTYEIVDGGVEWDDSDEELDGDLGTPAPRRI